MASRAQIAANRRNAQLSTGPRTLEGKAQSAANALKHGLRSERATLPSEDRAAHERLRADLFARHQPVGEAERRLVDRLALLEARLERAALADVAAWNLCWQEDLWPKRPAFGPAPGGLDHLVLGMGAALKAGVLKQLQLITLYERRLRRELAEARADLARLQAQRQAAEQVAEADDAEATPEAERAAAAFLVAHFANEDALTPPPAWDAAAVATDEDSVGDGWPQGRAAAAEMQAPPAP